MFGDGNPTVASYHHDPLYGRIAKAVDDILRRRKVVMPVGVLAGMSLLTRQHPEDWRCGRVPYLECVINCKRQAEPTCASLSKRRAIR